MTFYPTTGILKNGRANSFLLEYVASHFGINLSSILWQRTELKTQCFRSACSLPKARSASFAVINATGRCVTR